MTEKYFIVQAPVVRDVVSLSKDKPLRATIQRAWNPILIQAGQN
jgi:hypothetical protein